MSNAIQSIERRRAEARDFCSIPVLFRGRWCIAGLYDLPCEECECSRCAWIVEKNRLARLRFGRKMSRLFRWLGML